MAQRTGADRFLAPRASAPSTRVFLVLAALAVLLLSGCGGGGDDDSSASTSSTESAQAKQQDQSSSSSASPKAKGKQGSKGSEAQEANAPNAGKQGPKIAQPQGERERGATPAEKEELTVADISLLSPSLQANPNAPANLTAKYTCDGKDTWPQLRWANVPPETKELALFVMNLQPVEGKLFFDWAVGGIDPSLEGIEEGRLPKGAVTGINGFGKRGYSICPEGSSETFFFTLFALPKALEPSPGFDPRTLRDEALAISGNGGILAATYTR
jgi:phosphatidylethanolamine-binding protein (PEBP) family uncharacterized protein